MFSNTTANASNHHTPNTHLKECWQSDSLVWLNFGVGVLNSFVAVFGSCSNIFVCIVICKHNLWESSNQFVLIFFLAVADLMTSAIIVPIEATSYFTYSHEEYFLSPSWTVFQNALWFTLTTLSLYTLLLLTLDRFIGVRFPFQHLAISKCKISIVVVGVWVYACLVFVYYFFMQERPIEGYYQFIMPQWAQRIGFCVTFIIPLNLNTVLYLYIFYIVQRNAIKRTKISHAGGRPKYTVNVKLYLYVVAVYLLLWQPYCIYEIYILCHPEVYETCVGESTDSLLSSFIHFNCFCNAFIYSATSKTFKNDFKNCCLCVWTWARGCGYQNKKDSSISMDIWTLSLEK